MSKIISNVKGKKYPYTKYHVETEVQNREYNVPILQGSAGKCLKCDFWKFRHVIGAQGAGYFVNFKVPLQVSSTVV